MPEWTGYVLMAALATGFLAWVVAGVCMSVAAARGTVAAVQRMTAPHDSSVWLACHTVYCAHLETRHNVTRSGLVCSGCGHVAGT